jgi:hypothetical protein
MNLTDGLWGLPTLTPDSRIAEDLSTISPQVRELCELLICPARWMPRLTDDASKEVSYLDTWLNQLWVKHVWEPGRLGEQSYQLYSDGEMFPAIVLYDVGGLSQASVAHFDLDAGDADFEYDLARLVHIAREEIPALREAFLSKHEVALWRNIWLGGRDENVKHFIAPGVSREQALLQTAGRGSASKLFREAEEGLRSAVLISLEYVMALENFTFFEEIPSGQSRMYLEFRDPIGASGGQEVRLLCVQIDGSTGFIHCFPISEAEVFEALGVARLDYDSEEYPFVHVDDVFESLR